MTPKPPDPNPWSPIADVCRPDPEVTQESAWSNVTSYRSLLETEKLKEEEKLRHIRPYVFFLYEDGNISPAATLSKMSMKHLSLAGTHWLYFTPPKGPILLHMYSILHSIHPPSDLRVVGIFKGWNWPWKQDWSLLSDARILKINKGENLRGNCHCGLRARHTQ